MNNINYISIFILFLILMFNGLLGDEKVEFEAEFIEKPKDSQEIKEYKEYKAIKKEALYQEKMLPTEKIIPSSKILFKSLQKKNYLKISQHNYAIIEKIIETQNNKKKVKYSIDVYNDLGTKMYKVVIDNSYHTISLSKNSKLLVNNYSLSNRDNMISTLYDDKGKLYYTKEFCAEEMKQSPNGDYIFTSRTDEFDRIGKHEIISTKDKREIIIPINNSYSYFSSNFINDEIYLFIAEYKKEKEYNLGLLVYDILKNDTINSISLEKKNGDRLYRSKLIELKRCRSGNYCALLLHDPSEPVTGKFKILPNSLGIISKEGEFKHFSVNGYIMSMEPVDDSFIIFKLAHKNFISSNPSKRPVVISFSLCLFDIQKGKIVVLEPHNGRHIDYVCKYEGNIYCTFKQTKRYVQETFIFNTGTFSAEKYYTQESPIAVINENIITSTSDNKLKIYK